MLQQISNTLYEGICAALRRPLSQGGHLALTAALHGVEAPSIAAVMDRLAPAEALAVFNWLDNARAAEAILMLEPKLSHFLINNAPAGRVASLPAHATMHRS